MLVRWNQSLRHAQFKKNLGSGGECKCVHKWGEIVVSKVIPFRPFELDYLMDTSCVPKWPETPPGKCATINLLVKIDSLFWGGTYVSQVFKHLLSLSFPIRTRKKSFIFGRVENWEKLSEVVLPNLQGESDANGFASYSSPKNVWKMSKLDAFFEREMELRVLMVGGLPLFLCIHKSRNSNGNKA